MARHIDWYLVELERLLKGHVPGPKLAESLSEVEAHLQDGTDALAPACRHGQNPEELAIERFGSPWAFARATVAQASMQPYWRAARLPMAICFATGLLPLLAFGERADVVWWLGLGLVALAAASWAARRRTPVAILSSVATAAAVLLVAGAIYIAPDNGEFMTLRTDLPRKTVAIDAALKLNDEDQATLHRGVAAFSDTGSTSATSEFRVHGGYRVPGLAYGVQTRGGMCPVHTLAWSDGAPWRHAKTAWINYSPDIEKQLKSDAGVLRQRHDELQAELGSTTREAFATVAPAVSLGAAIFATLSLAINGLFAAISGLIVTAKLARRRLA